MTICLVALFGQELQCSPLVAAWSFAVVGKDEEQFSWAKRSRDSKKTYQDRVRDIVPDNPRRPQKGGNRGRRPNGRRGALG